MQEIKNNPTNSLDLEKKHLKCSFEIKNINNEDPNFFIFEGYASTFGNIDLGDDIVERGAFKDSLVDTPEIKILWQHDMNKPIGKSLLMREDDKGLFIKAQISKRTTLGSDAAALVEDGVIDSMSIGFIIKDYDIKEGIRHIKKLNLFETSLVTLPMNPQAKLTGYKSVDEVPAEIKAIEKFLKFKGLSSNESKAIISKIKDTMKQREVADQVVVREEQTSALISELKNLTNYLKGNK